MANGQRGEVSLTVSGRTYTLVLNTNAMAAIETHLSTPAKDVTWDEFWPRVLRGSVRAICVLLWGMSRKHHPELTVDDVGELVDAVGGLPGLVSVVSAANTSATPDPEDLKATGVETPKGDSKRPQRARAGAASISQHATPV
jgi:hypothetical protein